MPPAAAFSLPGFLRATLISSWRVLAGTAGFTMKTYGACPISATGWMSRSGS